MSKVIIIPNVVRIRISEGKIVQGCDLYIGRPCFRGGWNLSGSKWANPFSVNKYGREECLKLYEQHIRNRPDLWNNLYELEGKTLGCFCKPDPCHGDVLIKLFIEKHCK